MVAYFRGAIDDRHDVPGNWYNDSPGGAPLLTIPAVGNSDDEIVFDENGLVDCVVQGDWAVRSATFRPGYLNSFNANGYNFGYGLAGFYAVGAINATVYQGSGTWTHGGSFRLDADMQWYEGTATNIFVGGTSAQRHQISVPYRGGGSGGGAAQLYDVEFSAGGYWNNMVTLACRGSLDCSGDVVYNGGINAQSGISTFHSGAVISGGGSHNVGTNDVHIEDPANFGVRLWLYGGAELTTGNGTLAGKLIPANWTAGIITLANVDLSDVDYWRPRNNAVILACNNTTISGDVTQDGSTGTITATGDLTAVGAAAQGLDFDNQPVAQFGVNKAGGIVTLNGNLAAASFLGTDGTFDPNGKTVTTTGNCTWASDFAFVADVDVMNGCAWVVGGDFNCDGQVLNATAPWYLQVDGTALAAGVGSVEYCDASGFTEVQAAVGWTEDENTLNWAVPKSYADAVVVVAAGIVVPVAALTAFDASVIVASATVTISDEFEEILPCGASPPNPPETEELFPAGSAPTNRIPTLSALCSYGPTQLIMQGALRQVLVQHFADPRNILNATLRKKLERDGVWSPDADTGIYIESLHRWRPELTESRPGIILKEGEWRWKRMGIGDRGGVEWRSGKQHFGGIWNGNHTFFAVGNHGAEAQILAWEVAKVMLWFASEISQKLELHRFVPGSVGKVSVIAQEATENYAVPVSVAYAAFDTWYTQEEAPRLKRVVFRASEVLGNY